MLELHSLPAPAEVSELGIAVREVELDPMFTDAASSVRRICTPTGLHHTYRERALLDAHRYLAFSIQADAGTKLALVESIVRRRRWGNEYK